jgi:hypothetical protein
MIPPNRTKRLHSSLSVILSILLLLLCLSPTLATTISNPTYHSLLADVTVEISPIEKIVIPSETFSVDIYVSPSISINAVSFDILSFDPTLIHANSVVEGDLFEGAPSTLFNPGVIDNTLGEIRDVFDLTVPATYTVNGPGILCTISFTAQQNLGITPLGLTEVSVSNKTGGHASVTVINGTVMVNESKNYPPTISNAVPISGATDVPLSLSLLYIDIADLEGDNFAWSIETIPYIGSAYGSNDINGTKTCTISSLQISTTYTWFVNASDDESGESTQDVFTFTTTSETNRPPEIPLLSGPSVVKPDTDYQYNANTTDPDDDTISYFFDWGDGSDSGWTEYGPSGVAVTRSHAWAEGNYSIRVKSRDIHNIESDWSEPLPISVGKLISISNIKIGYFYFLNISWAYVYLFDLLGLSMVVNNQLTIEATVRETVDHVEFIAYGHIIGAETTIYDDNMSDGCIGRFDAFNVSHGLYDVTVIAYDQQGNEIDSDNLPLIIYIQFTQAPSTKVR